MSDDDLFGRIRAAAERVAGRARWVRIDPAGLERFAALLARESPAEPPVDPAHHALSDPQQTLAYVVSLDAINFGSGWFPALRKRDGRSGYLTIAAALRRRFEREGAWSASALRGLDAGDCSRVFDQRDNPEVGDLMALYARALVDLGELLERRFGGSFATLVESAEHSAAELVRILCAMPGYRDLAWHRGEPVPLYKRAQITASDLALAFGGQGWGRFQDLAELTLFADNLVPHVLRCQGVLRYEDGLARRIDAGRPIEAGSEREVEIRAVAVHAVEQLVGALRAAGLPVCARELDQRLWQRGQRPEIKARPRHRARSVYY